jgi:hypothetical protein
MKLNFRYPRIFIIYILLIFPLIAESSNNSIGPKDLPFAPLEHGKIVIVYPMNVAIQSAELFNNPSTKLYNYTETNKPCILEGDDDHIKMGYSKVPTEYIVAEQDMLRIWDKNKGKCHFLQIIEYKKKRPWILDSVVGVLLWDHQSFCMYFGDGSSDNPEFGASARLDDVDGKCQLDVGITESGTGAFSKHAIFTFSHSGGPELIAIKESGRKR